MHPDAHPLAVWREKNGVSRIELARKLGIARSAIAKYEAGRMPVAPVLNHLVILTDGEISANDWLGRAAAITVARRQERLRA